MTLTAGPARQSPFARLDLDARQQSALGDAGLGLIPRGFRALVDLRVDLDREPGAAAAVQGALGCALPTQPNSAGAEGPTRILWLGPDEWLVVVDDPDPWAGPNTVARLREALGDHVAAVVDVSGAQAALGVTGPQAREVLERAVPLDLHPRSFQPGQVKQTLLGRHCGASLHLLDATPTFDLYCRRSFADYVVQYLEDCARGTETTVAVLPG
jgi:sarcosine oxidase subunit gamma